MAKQAKNKQKGATAKKPRRPDPVVTEIVRNGVIAVTEEMKTNLMRTAYNTIIYEGARFHYRVVYAGRRMHLDRDRAADVHPRHG